ncbi:MAG: GAF domain-containing protein [Balneolaceae bacterium]|nr:GAF domain-containing protein [Balneolaceae bacterium]
MGLYALEEGDLESIIHRAVQQLCLTLGVEYVLLLDWDKKENTLRIMANTGWELTENSIKEIKAEKEWDVGYALRAEKPVLVSNYAEEEFKLSPLLTDTAVTSGLLLKVIESNETCGILGIYSKKKREFTKHDLNFLQIVGNLIGMSSERIKSKKNLEETNKKLKKEIERSKKFQKQILNNSILERWDLGGYLLDYLLVLLLSPHLLGKLEVLVLF